MLAIRLQRTGRSGHSQFRLVAQDSHFSPKRGRVVAYLGSYNPHTKDAKLDAKEISKYLENGAQPSDSAAKLLKKGGIKLPAWYSASQAKKGSVRNPEKRRSSRPAKAEAPAPAAEELVPSETSAEAPDSEAVASESDSVDTMSETAAEASAAPEKAETASE